MGSLGDRMKMYESKTQQIITIECPVFVRLDGKGFSKWTKNLEKPFDMRFSNSMIETTRMLVEEFNADIGYTQSDEITLLWTPKTEPSEHVFGGKVNKLISLLASFTTYHFNFLMSEVSELPPAYFDARAFTLPEEEIALALKWRWIDAKKNSVSQLAHHHFSPSKLKGVHTGDRLEMLREMGIDHQTLPQQLREGVMLCRKQKEILLTEEEMEKIPIQHQPEGPVKRWVIEQVDITDFLSQIQ